VRKPETAAYQAAVAKQLAHLVGMRICRDIEILRLPAQQQVAHAAAYQVRLVAGFFQAV